MPSSLTFLRTLAASGGILMLAACGGSAAPAASSGAPASPSAATPSSAAKPAGSPSAEAAAKPGSASAAAKPAQLVQVRYGAISTDPGSPGVSAIDYAKKTGLDKQLGIDIQLT